MSNRAEKRQFSLFLENVVADFTFSGHFTIYSGAVMGGAPMRSILTRSTPTKSILMKSILQTGKMPHKISHS